MWVGRPYQGEFEQVKKPVSETGINQLAFGHADGMVLGGASAATTLGSNGGSFPGLISPILVLRPIEVVESCLSNWGPSISPSVDTALERAGTK